MAPKSPYAGADIDRAVAELEARGLDLPAVSVACFLKQHADCNRKVYTIRAPGTPPGQCACTDPGHRAGHRAMPAAG